MMLRLAPWRCGRACVRDGRDGAQLFPAFEIQFKIQFAPCAFTQTLWRDPRQVQAVARIDACCASEVLEEDVFENCR